MFIYPDLPLFLGSFLIPIISSHSHLLNEIECSVSHVMVDVACLHHPRRTCACMVPQAEGIFPEANEA